MVGGEGECPGGEGYRSPGKKGVSAWGTCLKALAAQTLGEREGGWFLPGARPWHVGDAPDSLWLDYVTPIGGGDAMSSRAGLWQEPCPPFPHGGWRDITLYRPSAGAVTRLPKFPLCSSSITGFKWLLCSTQRQLHVSTGEVFLIYRLKHFQPPMAKGRSTGSDMRHGECRGAGEELIQCNATENAEDRL